MKSDAVSDPMMVSLPAPPNTVSPVGSFHWMESLPAPPNTVSLPARAVTVSLPLPPKTMSLPAPA